MKRLGIALILTCVLSISALAGDIPTKWQNDSTATGRHLHSRHRVPTALGWDAEQQCSNDNPSICH